MKIGLIRLFEKIHQTRLQRPLLLPVTLLILGIFAFGSASYYNLILNRSKTTNDNPLYTNQPNDKTEKEVGEVAGTAIEESSPTPTLTTNNPVINPTNIPTSASQPTNSGNQQSSNNSSTGSNADTPLYNYSLTATPTLRPTSKPTSTPIPTGVYYSPTPTAVYYPPTATPKPDTSYELSICLTNENIRWEVEQDDLLARGLLHSGIYLRAQGLHEIAIKDCHNRYGN